MNKKKKTIIICAVLFFILIILLIFFLSKVNKKYVVEFDSNGGSIVEEQLVKAGDTATKPSDPKRDGYKFVEWQFDDEEFDFDTKINNDITLKAKWAKDSEDEKTYIVRFDSDGGSIIASQIIKDGEKIKKPADPTKKDYKFVEWTYNGVAFDFSKSVSKDVTLKAKWEKEESKEEQKDNKKSENNNKKPANNGSGSQSNSGNNGGSVTPTPTPTPDPTPDPPTPPVQKNYTISAAAVDQYSPDRTLSVKENGSVVSFSSIKYNDGTLLCSGANPTVNASDIAGESSFIVVLSDGSTVNATLS